MVRPNEQQICSSEQECKRYLQSKEYVQKSDCHKGVISSKAVYDIKWLPGSENLFLAAHGDGSLILYDKEKDDPTKEEVAAEKSEATPKKGSVKKTNPVARWQLSKQTMKAFAFSPDGKHIAAVSEDGCLRVLRYNRESYE